MSGPKPKGFSDEKDIHALLRAGEGSRSSPTEIVCPGPCEARSPCHHCPIHRPPTSSPCWAAPAPPSPHPGASLPVRRSSTAQMRGISEVIPSMNQCILVGQRSCSPRGLPTWIIAAHRRQVLPASIEDATCSVSAKECRNRLRVILGATLFRKVRPRIAPAVKIVECPVQQIELAEMNMVCRNRSWRWAGGVHQVEEDIPDTVLVGVLLEIYNLLDIAERHNS